MKWAVNVRTKTLVISLRAWEVKELFLAIEQVDRGIAWRAPEILGVRMGIIVRDALRIMAPKFFPPQSVPGRDEEFDIERVELGELCELEAEWAGL